MDGLRSNKMILSLMFVTIHASVLDGCEVGKKVLPEASCLTHRTHAMDQALVTIYPDLLPDIRGSPNLSLFTQSAACYKCSLEHLVHIPIKWNCSVQLQTKFNNQMEVRNMKNNRVIWKTEAGLTQHSEYILYITNKGHGKELTCNLDLHKEAKDSNIPIYVAMCIYAVLIILWVVIKYTKILNKIWKTPGANADAQLGLIQNTEGENEESNSEAEVQSEDQVTTPTPFSPINDKSKSRLSSLDAFRGICLCIMIFVNYGGGGYWFFDHSYWHGLTVADLVFPWFTWIIGTAIALSFRNIYSKGQTTKLQLSLKVLRRTAILFFIGLALESSDGSESVKMSHLRIPGVLQRLAVSYAVVALLQVHFAQDYVEDQHKDKWFSEVRDIFPFYMEWLVMFTLVTLHLMFTFLISEEGCPRGYLGAGGLSEGGQYENCTGGAAGYIDRKLFGVNHIYATPTCQEVYKTTVPYDPEGTLGTMTSIFMCFLGLQAGKILVYAENWVRKVVRWLLWASLTGLIAGCLCRFSQNDGWIPLNKNLWSISFVLALASMAFFLLTACYVAIDVYKIWSGAPFIYPGMNSILVYISHIVFQHYFPVSWEVQTTHSSLLALHLWGVMFWTAVSAILYRKQIFIAI